MKKLLVTVCAAAFAFNANAGGEPNKMQSAASPFENFYATVSGGYSKSMNLKGDFGKKDMGSSAIIGLGLKTDIYENLKAGFNFEYRPSYEAKSTTVEDGTSISIKEKYKISSLMLTGSYDITALDTFFTPYVEVGVGAARVKSPKGSYTIIGGASGASSDKTKTNFAYSAGLGAKFKVSENVNFGLGYKYSSFGKFNNYALISGLKETMNAKKLHSNDLIASLEYKF